MIESLECRRLFFTMTVAGPETSVPVGGQVFFDKDHNGKISDRLHVIDDGIAGVRVYLDDNKNGGFDKGERFRFTVSNGGYDFGYVPVEELAPVRIVLGKGQVQTTGGGLETRFGIWSVQRNAFFSLDTPITNSYREVYEPKDVLIKGVRLYVDFNRNGKRDKGEPTGDTTGDSTKPTLLNVTPGKYQLRIQPTDGFRADRRYAEVRVGDRETRSWSMRMSPSREIKFTFYEDVNLNGKRDANEARRSKAAHSGAVDIVSKNYNFRTAIYAKYQIDDQQFNHIKLPPGEFSIEYEQRYFNTNLGGPYSRFPKITVQDGWADGMTLELPMNAD